MAIIVLTTEMLERNNATDSDIDGLSAMARNIEGVDLGVMIRETPEGCKISARSSKAVSACEFCKLLGGGGHPAAAGCTLKGASVEEAKHILTETAAKIL